MLLNLTDLGLASNRLSKLPLTIAALASLKNLDLSSNLMEYINDGMMGWSRLDTLDLTHNMLRSLPIEFATITLHVDVQLGRNPIDDLPNKWNETYTNSSTYKAPFGYTDTQIVEWVRETKLYYEAAIEEWAETGAMHYDGKSTIDNFMKAVRIRCGKEWQERLRPFIKRFYFEAKENGVVPSYHMLTREEGEEKQRLVDMGEKRRELRARVAKRDHLNFMIEQQELYGEEIPGRIAGADVNHLQRMGRHEVEQHSNLDMLLDDIGRRVKAADQHAVDTMADREREKYEEMQRMLGYVDNKVNTFISK